MLLHCIQQSSIVQVCPSDVDGGLNLVSFQFVRQALTFPPFDGQSENGRVDFRRESTYG